VLLTILLTIGILAVLVLAHEGGHFFAAKRAGVRVDEFGFGFPPRLLSRRRGETTYSLNLLPFGGFVRILGEDGDRQEDPERNFTRKPLWVQLNILLAGVAMNWIVAAGIFGAVTIIGAPIAVSDDEGFPDAAVTITAVAKGSPAERAGIKTGDAIVAIRSTEASLDPVHRISDVQELLRKEAGKELTLVLRRNGEERTVELTPRISPPEGEGPAGVALVRLASVSYPWYEAWWRGMFIAAMMTVTMAQGFADLLLKLLSGGNIGGELAGPIGIAAITGEVRTLGVLFVLNFIAMLSLNLVLLNALPFPALDGGRALTAVIERVSGKRISPRLLAWFHAAGFTLLMVLILLLTIHDLRTFL
jgi:regulator of sigma E protease